MRPLGVLRAQHHHHHAAAPRRTARCLRTPAAPPTHMQRLTSVTEVLDSCSGILLDQFGVLHDGRTPYPHAVGAVRALARAGKRIVVLSNSSRRSGGTIGKLVAMGFEADWFAGAITSGELTHCYLAERPDPWWQQLGTRCIHVTWSSRGTISLDGLALQVVQDPQKADFILAHGTEAVGLPGGGTRDASLEQLGVLLEQCAAAARARGVQLPLICANPDMVTVDGPNGLITMPGTLAKQYRDLGGHVQLMGKPDPIIYAAAQQLASGDGSSSSSSSTQERWLAIGDSLEHDVAGAAKAGLQTLFIVGGIHAAEVGLSGAPADGNTGSSWDEAALAVACARHGVEPTFAMAFLSTR